MFGRVGVVIVFRASVAINVVGQDPFQPVDQILGLWAVIVDDEQEGGGDGLLETDPRSRAMRVNLVQLGKGVDRANETTDVVFADRSPALLVEVGVSV